MPAKLTQPLIERLLARVVCDVQTQCWNYVGGYTLGGYGMIVVAPRKQDRTHRAAYRELVGPIPPGAVVHHVCENKLCCNPAHLLVTTVSAHVKQHKADRRKSICPRGHPLTTDNLIANRLKRGHRACLTCYRASMRASYHNNKEKWKARKEAMRAKDPAKYLADARRYRAANPERTREANRIAQARCRARKQALH